MPNITIQEIELALSEMKNAKAPREDGLVDSGNDKTWRKHYCGINENSS